MEPLNSATNLYAG